MEENESISFGIIASSGTARSLAFEALEKAKEGNFEDAQDLIDQSEQARLRLIIFKQSCYATLLKAIHVT